MAFSDWQTGLQPEPSKDNSCRKTEVLLLFGHQEILSERTGGHISCRESHLGVSKEDGMLRVLNSIICLTMVATRGRPVMPSGYLIAKDVYIES